MDARAPASGVSPAAAEPADVAVAGGGPVGCVAALLLARAGARVILLDARRWAEPPRDPRVLALSHASRVLLERVGAWEELRAAAPIKAVHVSEAGRFGQTVITPRDAGVPALGYVLEFGAVLAALRACVLRSGVTLVDGTVVEAVTPDREAIALQAAAGRTHCARLAVLADGGAHLEALGFRQAERRYAQSALTARVTTDLPSRGVAYERFTAEGPVALLPCGAEWALVWTVPPEKAETLRELPAADFLAALQHRFGGRAGRFVAVRERVAFPLALRWVRSPVGERCVLAGNAAHTLHPVAGQGLNLGLRDAGALAELAAATPRAQWGGAAWLARYARARRLDAGAGIAVTDALVRVFSNDLTPLRIARDLGLSALGCLPSARAFLARRMIFGIPG
jgi:2-octaprenyl-6-methoxyphenol hydroxylase